jgi:hypothetical protein
MTKAVGDVVVAYGRNLLHENLPASPKLGSTVRGLWSRAGGEGAMEPAGRRRDASSSQVVRFDDGAIVDVRHWDDDHSVGAALSLPDGKFVHVWLHAGGDAGEGRLHAIWSAADDHLIGIVADVGSGTCHVLQDEELDQFL